MLTYTHYPAAPLAHPTGPVSRLEFESLQGLVAGLQQNVVDLKDLVAELTNVVKVAYGINQQKP